MKDAESFDEFYHATRTRLLHQMYAMTGNLADAQDCVQEAYARAWQRWEQVSQHASPEAWLRTVSWRIAASRWRKVRNGVAAMARHGTPSNTPEPSTDNVALVEALKQIPEAQRRAIVLHHLADLSVEEVAAEMGVATGTIKARLSRGRAALANLLREEDGTATSTTSNATSNPAPNSKATKPSAKNRTANTTGNDEAHSKDTEDTDLAS